MSAVSSRPAVPRPSVRASTVPPPAASSTRSVPPSSPSEIPKAYESAPPVIRDRLPTLELADDDLVEAEPVAVRPRSTPPPAPPARSTIVPKLQGVAVPTIAPHAVPNIDLPMPHTLKLVASVPMPMPVAPAPAAAPVPTPAAAPAPITPVAREPEPASRVEVKRARPEVIKARFESVLDPTEVLFEGMYELELVESSWQAASVCASALARALGARAVVVHAHDLARRELRAIGVHGDRTADLLGSLDLSDDDLVASAVICNEKAVTMRFDGELPRLAPRRLTILGAPRTLVAVPAMAWGRCVAIIEIIDADDRFASRVADSAAYVAERLAAYLSGRLAA
jgi:hypothetical protein